MTVSYSFNRPERVADDTRAKVFHAAAELGYRPDATARALRSGRSKQLGVVVGEHLSYLFDDPQALQFLAGVADVCVAADLGVVLIPTRGDSTDVDRVLTAAVDGYVLWTTVSDDPVLAAVASSGRPAAIQGGPAHPGFALVGPDDRAAAATVAATLPLAEATVVIVSFPTDRHRTPAVVLGRDLPAGLTDPQAVPFPVTGARLAGYRDAVLKAGLDWNRVRVAIVERNQRDLGEAAMKALFDEGDGAGPVVVLAMSDELALGARSAAQRTQRSVTISGWDGSAEATASGIWSVSASLREQGRACARLALGDESENGSVGWEIVAPR